MEPQEETGSDIRGMAVAYCVQRYSEIFKEERELEPPLSMADAFAHMKRTAEWNRLSYLRSLFTEYEIAIRDIARCSDNKGLHYPERPFPVRIRRRQIELRFAEREASRAGNFVDAVESRRKEKEAAQQLEEIRGVDLAGELRRKKEYCEYCFHSEGHFLRELHDRSRVLEERLLDEGAYAAADEVDAFSHRVWERLEEMDAEIRGGRG